MPFFTWQMPIANTTIVPPIEIKPHVEKFCVRAIVLSFVPLCRRSGDLVMDYFV